MEIPNSLKSGRSTATTAYLGQYGNVTLTIDLANPSAGIQKPLIVAEGFDIGTLLDPENTDGMEDYEGFRDRVNFSFSNDLKNLIWQPTNKEYDIIYVDWNNGADYLQRNAYALQAVIAWVNQEKASNNSTEPNVILGQSMGGVIARYALTDMEERNLDHDTRLFISHGAPQQGANIPMGLQYMYRHMTNQYITASTMLFGGIILVPLLEDKFGVSSYLSILDTPAARQMLTLWSNTGYGMDNIEHDNFYNELKGLNNNNGYPIEIRNIAISNGSECGNTQGFYAGDHFLSFQYNRGLSFWGDLASLIYNPLGGAIGGLFLDPDFFRSTFLGMIPGSSKYIVDFQVKTISYQNGYQIYKGLVRYKKKILWLFDSQVSITNIQCNQPNNILPYDFYGGGFYDTSDIAQAFTDEFPDTVIGDHFGFIPTVSSLDIGGGGATLNDLDFKESYVGANPPSVPKNSPFINFSTEYNPYNPQAHNYRHLAFNTRNGNWLAKELDGEHPITDCSYACDAGITGPNDLCSTAVFSVSGGAPSYTWSITSGSALASITDGNGTNQITVTKTGNGQGSITLKVVYGDDYAVCGNLTLTKVVSVGLPLFVSVDPVGDQSGYNPSEPDISLGTGACNQISLQAVFDSHSPILEYQWEKITTDVSWSVYQATGYFSLSPQCNKDFTFKVRVRNACGWTAWEEITYSMNRCTENCGQGSGSGTIVGTNFVLSPNPVSQGLIEAKVKSGAPWFTTTVPDPDPMDPGTGTGEGGGQVPVTDFSPTVNITLYNLSGIAMLPFPNSQLATTLNISSLSTGSYIMQLEYQGLIESHTIVKQ